MEASEYIYMCGVFDFLPYCGNGLCFVMRYFHCYLCKNLLQLFDNEFYCHFMLFWYITLNIICMFMFCTMLTFWCASTTKSLIHRMRILMSHFLFFLLRGSFSEQLY